MDPGTCSVLLEFRTFGFGSCSKSKPWNFGAQLTTFLTTRIFQPG